MSREIKFRAWDKVESLMVYIEEINWRDDFICGSYQKGGTSGIVKDYILMQYTGLKDKNGKEIYEGDITNYGKVVWVAQAAAFRINPSRNNTDISFTESFANHDDIEVIGNLYENPDLLKS